MSEIFETLTKVKALADGGATEHERAAAQRKLDEMLTKHGLMPEVFERSERGWYGWLLPKADHTAIKLWFQVIFKFASDKVETKDRDASAADRAPTGRVREFKVMMARLTELEHADCSAAFEHYLEDYKRKEQLFLVAYIHRNRLTLDSGKSIPRTNKEYEDIARIMLCIDANPLTKRLTN